MIFNHLFFLVIEKILPPNTTIDDQYRVEPDSNLLIQKVFSIHDSEYELRFNDGIKLWSNDFVKITNFAGTPEYPAKFLKEFILQKDTIIRYSLRNLSSQQQKIQLVFQCQKITKEPTEPYKYRQFVENFVLSPNSKISKVLQFDNSKKFFVQKLLAYNSEPEEEITIDTFDLSSLYSRSLISNSININNAFGRAMKPNLIPELQIEPYSVGNISLNNNSNKTVNVQICFDGYELI